MLGVTPGVCNGRCVPLRTADPIEFVGTETGFFTPLGTTGATGADTVRCSVLGAGTGLTNGFGTGREYWEGGEGITS